MRLVCSSDWHIGFRAYQKLTPTGINVREADCAQSFARLIDGVIRVAPDVLVVGGDQFHRNKPGNPAIVHAFNQISRLRAALPDLIIVMVSGNHDAPKASGDGCILPLFSSLGVRVIDRAATRLRFGELAVFAAPDVPGIACPEIVADTGARWNVAIVHGEVSGAKQTPSGMPMPIANKKINAGGLAAGGFDFCGFGHYHQYEEVAPRCWYAGSLDFCSADPWKEIRTPKGFIEHDLVTGAHAFHVLEPSRRYIDLPAIDASGMGAGEVDTAIRDAVESPGGIDDAVVRLKLLGITREVSHALDHAAIRRYKKAALNFHLDERRPDRISAASRAMLHSLNNGEAEQSATPREGTTVSQRVDRHLDTMELANDVDRAVLKAMAQRYLSDAGEATPDVVDRLLPSPNRAA